MQLGYSWGKVNGGVMFLHLSKARGNTEDISILDRYNSTEKDRSCTESMSVLNQSNDEITKSQALALMLANEDELSSDLILRAFGCPPGSFVVDIFIDIEIDSQSLTIPYGFEELSNLIGTNNEIDSKILELATDKKCKLIEYNLRTDEETCTEISIVCRELENGYYLGVSIQPSTNKNECLASYIYLFSRQQQIGELEKTWHKLTQKASTDDWADLDCIISELIHEYSGDRRSTIFFIEQEYYANHRAVYPDIVQEIMRTCAMSVYQESGLTALVIADEEEQRGFGVILNNGDNFVQCTAVYDDFEDIELCFELPRHNPLSEGFSAYMNDTLTIYCDADSEDEDEDN